MQAIVGLLKLKIHSFHFGFEHALSKNGITFLDLNTHYTKMALHSLNLN